MVLDGVSRETSVLLEVFADELVRWTKRINLIAPATVADVKHRHIEDSLQLANFLSVTPAKWCDLGSGGGLPGIPLAILAQGWLLETQFVLIESDARKAAFLRTISTKLDLPVTTLSARIEAVPPQAADIVSARALAPLDKLLGYVHRHLKSDGTALLMKGRNHAEEVEAARRNWHFDLEVQPSRTDPEARILVLRNIARAD